MGNDGLTLVPVDEASAMLFAETALSRDREVAINLFITCNGNGIYQCKNKIDLALCWIIITKQGIRMINSKLVISERNRLKTLERELTSYVRLNSNSIVRLRGATTNVDHNRLKMKKLKAENEKLSAQLKDIRTRMDGVSRGDFNKELREEARRDTETSRSKFEEKRA